MNNNTLLAILLGLHYLDSKLTSETKSSLKRLVRLFQMDDDWEEIQKQLESLLANNQPLNQGYQAAKESLEELDIKTLSDLLPNQNDIKLFMPYDGQHGYHPGNNPHDQNHEILNIGKVIADHEKPVETAKTLLQLLDNFLKRQFTHLQYV